MYILYSLLSPKLKMLNRQGVSRPVRSHNYWMYILSISVIPAIPAVF